MLRLKHISPPSHSQSLLPAVGANIWRRWDCLKDDRGQWQQLSSTPSWNWSPVCVKQLWQRYPVGMIQGSYAVMPPHGCCAKENQCDDTEIEVESEANGRCWSHFDYKEKGKTIFFQAGDSGPERAYNVTWAVMIVRTYVVVLFTELVLAEMNSLSIGKNTRTAVLPKWP